MGGGPVSYRDECTVELKPESRRVTFSTRMFAIIVLPLACSALIPVSAARAQDSMQLDVEFKESLTRGALPIGEKRFAPRQRSEPHAAQARTVGERPRARKHPEPSR